MSDGKPWERQETESNKAFNAFQVYLNQKPNERSVRAAYEVIKGSKLGPGKLVPGTFRKWSVDNRWVARADAWDNYLADEMRAAELKAVRDMAKRRVDAYSLLMTVGQTLVSKAKLQDLGEKDARAMLGMVIQFIEAGARGQRLELGEPTEHATVDVRTGGNPTPPGTITEGALEAIVKRGGLFTLPDTES